MFYEIEATQAAKVTPDMFPLKAGTPVKIVGGVMVIANDSNAHGLIIRDVDTIPPQESLYCCVAGVVDLNALALSTGFELSSDAKSALTGIRFVEIENKGDAKPVTGITMSDSTASIVKSTGTKTLTATIAPVGADPEYTWTTSTDKVTLEEVEDHPEKITVNAGAAAGEAVVTCSVPGYSCSCTVTVTNS